MISILPKIKAVMAHIKKYKYHWVAAVFLIWVLFFDQNNLCRSVSDIVESHRLEKEKSFYLEKIERYSIMLNELKTSLKMIRVKGKFLEAISEKRFKLYRFEILDYSQFFI